MLESMAGCRWAATLLLALLAAAACTPLHAARLGATTSGVTIKAPYTVSGHSKSGGATKKDKHPYISPTGLFIQERASKQLPGPGQHFSFGALVPWEKVHETLDSLPDSKLAFLIRHGQAVSNYLSDSLGPDEWFNWESKCSYTDPNGTFYGIFDADLTDLGKAEATALNSMLRDGGWFDKLTAGRPTRAIVSPLSRCLETATLSMQDLNVSRFDVDENVRETLGEDTCDARRAASDPEDGDPAHVIGPCQFTAGLRTKFPQFEFPVVPPEFSAPEDGLEAGRTSRYRSAFGLYDDKDPMWTVERESQSHQTRRAMEFLQDLFELVEERVVFVVTHSGTTRSLLLAVGREPYRPQNTELVPVIIQRKPRRPQALPPPAAVGPAPRLPRPWLSDEN